MRILSTILLVAVLSTPAKAQDCQEVIQAADLAIQKRNELIQLQAGRIDQLRDDNQRLQEAVLTLKQNSDNANRDTWLYGAGGVVLGLLVGALVSK